MSSGKQPAGGFDSTQLHPSRQPTYTCKITFHRAYNLPVADFGRRSADPFVLAHLKTSLPTRHPQDPPIRFRSKTVWRSLAPEWNAAWVVAGVPQSGMTLKVRLYDEDPEDHDDRLGSIEVDTGRLDENWKGIKEADYKVHRHGASFRAYTLQWCSKVTHKGKKLHAQMVISIEMLGRTKEELGKVYTINNFWWIHYSPMIGRLAGVKSSEGGAEKFK